MLIQLQRDGEYLNGTLSWKVGSGYCGNFQEEELKYGRRCIQSISGCPSGSDTDASAKCGAYSLLLSEDNKVLRFVFIIFFIEIHIVKYLFIYRCIETHTVPSATES